MALPTVFYCNPTEAKELGYTITKPYTLSSIEATKLRDQYDAFEAGEAWTVCI